MTYYFDAEGVPFTYEPELDRGLVWDTSPPREVKRDFRDDVRVSVDRGEFERLRAARYFETEDLPVSAIGRTAA